MASLWRHPKSDFFVACFSVHVPAGAIQRWKRSIKTTDRKSAQRIADVLEDAGRGTMSEADINAFTQKIHDARTRNAAARVLGDVFRAVEGREIGAGSLRAFATSWVESVRGELAAQSYLRYRHAIEKFLEFLGTKGDRDVMSFGPRDDELLTQFRDGLAGRVSVPTVNTTLRIVKQMFKVASHRYRIDSPGRLVGPLKSRMSDHSKRRAFTLPEIGRILHEVRGSEWEGIILAGLYTGQRLGDLATLRWENVDLVRRELTFTARKTNRHVVMPVAQPLLDYLLTRESVDSATEFVFPKAAGHVIRSKSEHVGRLSNQFYDILARTGLVRRRSYRNERDETTSRRRKINEISFHSFRHTATSLLKNAGIPQAVVMDIIGHESRAISQLYTHVGEPEKRHAIAALLSAAQSAKKPNGKRQN
jgi:integrase